MVECPLPVNGTGALLETTSETYSYQEVANYTCIDDAAMVTDGSLSLLCEANGEWSDEPPTCSTYCLVLPTTFQKYISADGQFK